MIGQRLDAPSRATCRHSSAPIEPPPPVTSTRLPDRPRADGGPVELHRVASEQILDRDFLELVETATRPATTSSRRGTVRNGRLHASHNSTTRRICALLADGIAITAFRQRSRARSCGSLFERPEHRNAMHARAAQVRRCRREIQPDDSGFRAADRAPALRRHVRRRAPARAALGAHAPEIETAVFPVAIRQARRAEQHREYQRIQSTARCAARSRGGCRETGQGDRQRTEHAGARRYSTNPAGWQSATGPCRDRSTRTSGLARARRGTTSGPKQRHIGVVGTRMTSALC